MISVVMPTIDGREVSCVAALAPVEARDDVEVIMVHNAPSSGKAWVEGAQQATGDYIFFDSDDTMVQPGFFEAMIEALDMDMLPASTVLEVDGTLQSCGGAGTGVCCLGCPDWAIVEWTPTVMIRGEWWPLIEPHAEMLEQLHYSSDRLVSAILGAKGIRSVVRRPAVIVHSNHPVGRGAGMPQNERAYRDHVAFNDYRREHGL